MIKAVIIDDEEISRKTLKNLVTEYFPEIEIVAMASSVAEGVKCIETHNPGLVFLDIAMPDGDGFRVLEKTPGYNYEVIFITAYHDYAIRAFEFSALHYLLKPVNIEDLEQAIGRYKNSATKISNEDSLEILKFGLKDIFRKIALPTNDSIVFVELVDIMRCEASHNYTIFYLKNNKTVVMSKSLHKYEKLLEQYNFFRIHDKHLVNLKYIVRYIRGRGGSAVLEDGTEVEVSARKKDEFLRKLVGVNI